MKRVLLPLLSTFLLFSVAQANEMNLNFNKAFEKKVKNDILKVNIRIDIEKLNEKKALKELEPYQKFLKENDNIIKNMVLNSNPVYSYDKIKRKNIIRAYVASLNFNLETKKYEEIDIINTELVSIKNRDFNTNISISNYSWTISDKTRKKLEEELKEEAIVWGFNYNPKAKNINCIVKDLNLSNNNNNNNYYSNNMRMSSMKMEKSNGSLNINKGINNITINANYKFLCEKK